MSNSDESSFQDSTSSIESADFDMEVEDGVKEHEQENQYGGGGIVPYADEPVASEEWQQNYDQRKKDDEELLKTLKQRLEGVEPVENWCKCGRCSVSLLQNPYECLCCQDIEKCKESLLKDEVLDDPAVLGEPPQCITLHPGFSPICLERWSLRMVADKLRTRERKRYQQTGSEDAFLRSVSYREYIFLVYGRLGRIRQSLPACAYNAIRKQFPSTNDASFKGYEDNEEEQFD